MIAVDVPPALLIVLIVTTLIGVALIIAAFISGDD